MSPIEVDGSVARVAAGYSLKVPTSAAYSSQDAHVTFSVEFDVAGQDIESIQESLEALQQQLHANAKLAVMAQLGIDFETTDGGVLQPVIKSAPSAVLKSARGGGGGGSSSGGGGGQQRTPPKADASKLPIVVLGGVAYRDQRGLKLDNTYKPGAADFKSVDKVDGRFAQLWLYSKDGDLNEETASLLEESGVDYD